MKSFLPFLVVLTVITCSGCSGVPKSFKETTLDDMYSILSEEQYEILKSLDNDDEIRDFVEDYWRQHDPTPDTGENELRSEYIGRLVHANENFPDRRGWGRSDQKRIYLIHGPPAFTVRHESISTFLASMTWIKAMKIWLYAEPARFQSLTSFDNDHFHGQKRFIFADLTGAGFYTLIFSSEDYMDIDPRLLEQVITKALD